MAKEKYMSMREVAEELGVKFWRIAYVYNSGKLEEPQRIAGRRFFTKKDLRKLAKIFNIDLRKNDNDA